MDFGALLEDSFTYAKEGILGNANRWMSLILATILLCIPLNGYLMRIYRGTTTAPEVDQWGTLFVDGLKLIVVGLVYAIPIMIVWFVAYGSMFIGVLSGSMDSAALAGWEPNLGLEALLFIVEIIVGIFTPIAFIRFARTGSFGEAFNFSAVLETIGKIGWVSYLLALIIVALVIGIPIAILTVAFILIGGIAIALVGGDIFSVFGVLGLLVLFLLILAPFISVFQARYLTKVYESADAAA